MLTIWTGERIYLICRKATSDDGQAIVQDSLEFESCAGDHYLELVKQMLDGAKCRASDFIWVILKESFPYGSFQGKGECWNMDGRDRLSRLCSALPDGYLPSMVFNGVDVMKAMIAQYEDIWKPGCGALMEMGDKGFFIGYAEDDPFVRISRNSMPGATDSNSLPADWLQQTRMLYQNQSGYQLKKIYHITRHGTQSAKPETAGIIVEPVTLELDDAGTSQNCQLSVLLSLLDSNSSFDRVCLDIVQARTCRAELVRGFKMGAGLLILGGFLLLGAACKTGAFNQPVDASSHKQWDVSIAEWENAERIWKEKSTRVRNRRVAILLAGKIGSSLPEPVRLTRLQLKKSPYPGGSMDMVMEGSIDTEASSGEFQSWVDSLVDSGVLADVRNLQYEPAGRSLSFELHALANGGTRK